VQYMLQMKHIKHQHIVT